MKTLLKTTLFLSILSMTSAFAQKNRGIFGDNNWTENWTNYKPKSTIYRETEFILTGDIKTNTTLNRKNCYMLAGTVVVKANVTLTIEAGTVIRGDFASNGALIIEAGAKMIAEGTETDPIVFTSNREASDRTSGDWGGITLLGNSPINKLGGKDFIDLENKYVFGGNDAAESSGSLKFIRIEFAGKKLKNQVAFNALTFAGVGSGTTIENIQTSFSASNGFAFLGGNIKVTKLISFKNYIHDFAFNCGTNTHISNSIAFRFPNYSDASVSNAFEIKSNDDINLTDFLKKPTTVMATNITIISNDDQHQGIIKEAVFVGENTNFTLTQTIIHGFSPAIELDKKIKSEKLSNIVIQNVLFNQCKDAIVFDKKDFSANLNDLYLAENFLNDSKSMDTSEFLTIPDFKSNSNFMLKLNTEKSTVTISR